MRLYTLYCERIFFLKCIWIEHYLPCLLIGLCAVIDSQVGRITWDIKTYQWLDTFCRNKQGNRNLAMVQPCHLRRLTIFPNWILLTLMSNSQSLKQSMFKSTICMRYTAEVVISITLSSMFKVFQFTTNVFHKSRRKSFHRTLTNGLLIGLFCQSVMVLECSGAQVGLDEQLTAYVSGDITLGGLFPVHDKSTDPSIPCKPVINSERGIQVSILGVKY